MPFNIDKVKVSCNLWVCFKSDFFAECINTHLRDLKRVPSKKWRKPITSQNLVSVIKHNYPVLELRWIKNMFKYAEYVCIDTSVFIL